MGGAPVTGDRALPPFSAPPDTSALAPRAAACRVLTWLAAHELAAIVALTPLVLAAPRAALLALWIVPALWLLRTRHPLVQRGGLDAPLLCLLLLLPLPLFAVTDWSFALPKLVILLLGAALLRAVRDGLTDIHAWRWAARAFVAALAAVALLGLVATDWTSGKLLPLEGIYAHLPRLEGLALPRTSRGGIHPNEIAGTLALLLPLAVAVTLSHQGFSLGRLALAAATVLGFGVLVLTQSRMGYLGVLGGLFVLLVGWIATRGGRWGVGVATLAALLATGGIWLVANRLLLAAAAVGGGSLETPGSRLELWDRAFLMLRDYPFTGVGPGQFSAALHAHYTTTQVVAGVWVAHSHNLILQIVVEHGIPVAIAWFVLLLSVVVHLFQVVRRGDREARTIAIGCMGGLAALHLYGIGDAISLGAKPAILLWAMLGFAEAQYRLHQTQRQGSTMSAPAYGPPVAHQVGWSDVSGRVQWRGESGPV